MGLSTGWPPDDFSPLNELSLRRSRYLYNTRKGEMTLEYHMLEKQKYEILFSLIHLFWFARYGVGSQQKASIGGAQVPCVCFSLAEKQCQEGSRMDGCVFVTDIYTKHLPTAKIMGTFA